MNENVGPDDYFRTCALTGPERVAESISEQYAAAPGQRLGTAIEADIAENPRAATDLQHRAASQGQPACHGDVDAVHLRYLQRTVKRHTVGERASQSGGD